MPQTTTSCVPGRWTSRVSARPGRNAHLLLGEQVGQAVGVLGPDQDRAHVEFVAADGHGQPDRVLALGFDQGRDAAGQQRLVLLQRLLRFPLGLFRALQAALDLVGPLRQGLLDPGQQYPVQDREHDEERDGADDQLGEARG